MRVGLLTYGLDRPLSGTTRVAYELGRALSAVGGCEVVYLTPHRHGPFRAGESSASGASYALGMAKVTNRSWYLPGCRLLPGLLLLGGPLLALAARRLRLDVVHDPIGISPFTLGRWAGDVKRVVTLHDAIAFRYPEGYPWLNNFVHRRYVPATLPNVDQVITVSAHARSELAQFLPPPASTAAVVPNGLDRQFHPLPQEQARAVAARCGLRGRFVLGVGARQARKNHARLIEAFARVRAALPSMPDLQLAMAGPTQWRGAELAERIDSLGLRGAVVDLGYVPDADLPALYTAATAFAFPSLYEGFGLPVLEAMACGTPVVTSNTTSLPEVAGDAALLVNPCDADAIAHALRRLLTDGPLRQDLRTRGLARAARFTWDRTARETVAVYRRLVDAR
jgi:glycosyltransferase involved in cell wall biosynthesis